MTEAQDDDELTEWRAKVDRETRWVRSGWIQRILDGGSFVVNLLVMLFVAGIGMRVATRLFGPLAGVPVFLVVFGIWAFGGKARKGRVTPSPVVAEKKPEKTPDSATERKSDSKQDPVALLRRDAEQGNAAAQDFLATKYATGVGVPQSDAEAARWFRKAAEQGLAKAQLALGNSYSNGEGVQRSDVEAAKWYWKAAEQGLAAAQCNLGAAYSEGTGVPQDFARGYFWTNLAAAHPDGDNRGERARSIRDSLLSKLTPEQIAEVQRLSSTWKPTKT